MQTSLLHTTGKLAGLCFIFLFAMQIAFTQRVAISADGSSPDPSAMLHVISDSMGMLIPNLILDDASTPSPVHNPANGLLIYNAGGLEPEGFYYWDGMQWEPLLAGKLAILSDADNDTRIEVDDGTDPDEIIFTTEGSEVMRIGNTGNIGFGTTEVSWWTTDEIILRLRSPQVYGSALLDLSNENGSSWLNFVSGSGVGDHPQIRWPAGDRLRFYAHATDWSVFNEMVQIVHVDSTDQGYLRVMDHFRLDPRANAPLFPEEGAIYYDASANALKIWIDDGVYPARWEDLGGDDWENTDTSIYFNGGNVGIGLDSPEYKLDVFGSARIYDTVFINNDLNVTGTILVGSSINEMPPAGTIRWNPITEDFEGYDGIKWVSLTGKQPPPPPPVVDTTLIFTQCVDSTIHCSSTFSLSGSAFVSGYPYFDPLGIIPDAGQAWVFEYADSVWSEVKVILCPNPQDFDWFGSSVSISGNYAIIGSPGKGYDFIEDVGLAYIYFKEDTVWNYQNELTPGDYDFEDWFGSSVAISGDYAIVGAPGADRTHLDQGEVTIFQRTLTSWSWDDFLTASDAVGSDHFGSIVDISGEYAIITSAYEKVYVFHRSGSDWNEQAILLPSDGISGDDFGGSISISGDYIIIGSEFHDTGGHSDKGKAYIFHRSGTVWTEQCQLIASDGAAGDRFGNSVAISGDYAIVGAPFHDADANNSNNQGQAYLFVRSDTTWIEQTILVSLEGEAGDHFGIGVDISSDFALIAGGGGIYSYEIE